ncbi:MAG: hypothetical protein V2A53_00615 [bacterium]
MGKALGVVKEEANCQWLCRVSYCKNLIKDRTKRSGREKTKK